MCNLWSPCRQGCNFIPFHMLHRFCISYASEILCDNRQQCCLSVWSEIICRRTLVFMKLTNHFHLVGCAFVSGNWLISIVFHDDVSKSKHFPRYWPFVWGIYRSPVNSPLKGQWRGVLISKGEVGDLRHHRAHYGVTVMLKWACVIKPSPLVTTHTCLYGLESIFII